MAQAVSSSGSIGSQAGILFLASFGIAFGLSYSFVHQILTLAHEAFGLGQSSGLGGLVGLPLGLDMRGAIVPAEEIDGEEQQANGQDAGGEAPGVRNEVWKRHASTRLADSK